MNEANGHGANQCHLSFRAASQPGAVGSLDLGFGSLHSAQRSRTLVLRQRRAYSALLRSTGLRSAIQVAAPFKWLAFARHREIRRNTKHNALMPGIRRLMPGVIVQRRSCALEGKRGCIHSNDRELRIPQSRMVFCLCVAAGRCRLLTTLPSKSLLSLHRPFLWWRVLRRHRECQTLAERRADGCRPWRGCAGSWLHPLPYSVHTRCHCQCGQVCSRSFCKHICPGGARARVSAQLWLTMVRRDSKAPKSARCSLPSVKQNAGTLVSASRKAPRGYMETGRTVTDERATPPTGRLVRVAAVKNMGVKVDHVTFVHPDWQPCVFAVLVRNS